MSYGIYQVANQILIDYDDDDKLGGDGNENENDANRSPSLDELLTDSSIKMPNKSKRKCF